MQIKPLDYANKFARLHILVNRSMQLVARNHECPKEINNVPCVVWSCIKMHATYEIANYVSRLIIRAISCTLRMKSRITYRSLIIRAISCTLRTKSQITYRDESFVHQDARYVRNRELRIEVNHSCNKMHATHYLDPYA